MTLAKHSRVLSSLVHCSVHAVRRAALRNANAVASLNLKVEPSIFVVNSLILQDGDVLLRAQVSRGGQTQVQGNAQNGEENHLTKEEALNKCCYLKDFTLPF